MQRVKESLALHCSALVRIQEAGLYTVQEASGGAQPLDRSAALARERWSPHDDHPFMRGREEGSM